MPTYLLRNHSGPQRPRSFSAHLDFVSPSSCLFSTRQTSRDFQVGRSLGRFATETTAAWPNIFYPGSRANILYPEIHESTCGKSSQHQESRPQAGSNTGSPRCMDFPSLCSCSESNLPNLIGSRLNLLCLQSRSESESRWTKSEVQRSRFLMLTKRSAASGDENAQKPILRGGERGEECSPVLTDRSGHGFHFAEVR